MEAEPLRFKQARALTHALDQASDSVAASRKPRARSIAVRDAVIEFVMVKRGARAGMS